MRIDAFQSFLGKSLGATSVSSYLSNARAVERSLGIDLDVVDLSDPAIASYRVMLIERGMSTARAGDCQSVLRRYATLRHADIVDVQRIADIEPTLTHRPVITQATVAELMRLYAEVMDELRARGVTRTANAPIGDYAEMLFAQAFGWTLEPNSASGHDASDPAGMRYQIKARKIGPRNPSRQLGAIRRLPDREFDILAAVLFDGKATVSRAALIPYDVVAAVALRSEHTNSWRFILSDKIWLMPGVQDVTQALQTIESIA